MKQWMMSSAVAAALLGLTGAATAQETKPAEKPASATQAPAQPGRPPGGGQRQGGDRLQALAKELNLTKEQQDKLRPILTEETKQMRALRDDTSLSQQQRREKVTKIRDEYRKKIKDSKILTADQTKKWEEMQANARRRAGQGQGGGQRQGQGQGQSRPQN